MRTVECPDCKAGLGEPCISAQGIPKSNAHAGRKRLANRLANEERGI